MAVIILADTSLLTGFLLFKKFETVAIDVLDSSATSFIVGIKAPHNKFCQHYGNNNVSEKHVHVKLNV